MLPLFSDYQSTSGEGVEFSNNLMVELTKTLPSASLIFELAADWLAYDGKKPNTYASNRSEITRFLNFFLIEKKQDIRELTRSDIYNYIEFLQNPPTELITHVNRPQFKKDSCGQLQVNPDWRPFRSLTDDSGNPLPYTLSKASLKAALSKLSAFYDYIIDEDITDRNPVRAILKRGVQAKAITKDEDEIKFMDQLQLNYFLSKAEALALEHPETHRRTLFLVKLMLSCYLRISEIATRPGYTPTFGAIRRKKDSQYWYYFIPESKSGLSRRVSLSKDMMDEVVSYRRTLGLSDYPSANENIPLIASFRKQNGTLANSNLGIRRIRDLIGELFVEAGKEMAADGFTEQGQELSVLSPHALRHTGISVDLNYVGRPLKHVSEDAGHSSITTTEKYNHVSSNERFESARMKGLFKF
ncbi:tyrosine-type recombinase/integrase [Photobacterium leiognathi]|uniref:tyrosine-type recombinase/integrase n=1 Tax=Photobacterium leiognathi TaxID=553611 RepID=UPI002981A86B|nr:site-specific integrase [Photobacterium leiognathi]